MSKVPEIDYRLWLKDETKGEFVKKLGDALSDIGFFSLSNHGIPQELIDSTYSTGADFFALDRNQKSRYKLSDIGHQRGWTPFGTEHAKDTNIPDLKEFWQTGRTTNNSSATYPQNVWPDEEVPQFRQSFDPLYDKMEDLSKELLKAASLYLGMQENWLPEMAIEGNTIMRLIHYPPTIEPNLVRLGLLNMKISISSLC